MIRPARFFSNPDTSTDNSFQNFSEEDLTQPAQREFDSAVIQLRQSGIQVTVIQDSLSPITPDSVFPNNRLSFHQQGKVIIYPMMAPNRRQERQLKTVSIVEKKLLFDITQRIDYSHYESQQMFLEGTGSMILDRKHKIVYVALSQRSNQQLVDRFCADMGYQSIIFEAGIETDDENKYYRQPIYHTNVMLAIAEDFVVIADTVINPLQRPLVLDQLKQSGREIMTISNQQMKNFCGNILQLISTSGEKLIVLSQTAFDNFTQPQLQVMRNNNKLVVTNIPVIEKASGGSIRCMIAEIF